jgi:hypothetical protein
MDLNSAHAANIAEVGSNSYEQPGSHGPIRSGPFGGLVNFILRGFSTIAAI